MTLVIKQGLRGGLHVYHQLYRVIVKKVLTCMAIMLYIRAYEMMIKLTIEKRK